MSNTRSIPGTDEAWDEGLLGRDMEFARVTDAESTAHIDDSLDLQLISIRLPKSLIEDFKDLAQLHGLGYQPLMRKALQRFAEGEKKMVLQDAAREHLRGERQRQAERKADQEKTLVAKPAPDHPPAAQRRTKAKKAA
jgi:hypothetical protein